MYVMGRTAVERVFVTGLDDRRDSSELSTKYLVGLGLSAREFLAVLFSCSLGNWMRLVIPNQL